MTTIIQQSQFTFTTVPSSWQADVFLRTSRLTAWGWQRPSSRRPQSCRQSWLQDRSSPECHVLCQRLCLKQMTNRTWTITVFNDINVLNEKLSEIWINEYALGSVFWHGWLGVTEHLACEKLTDELLAWLSVWREVQMICIWSTWYYCHPVISCFIKIQTGLNLPDAGLPRLPWKRGC